MNSAARVRAVLAAGDKLRELVVRLGRGVAQPHFERRPLTSRTLGQHVDAFGLNLWPIVRDAMLDCNKRTAFQVMYVFSGPNGRGLRAPEPEVVETMLDGARGELREEELAAWIRAHTERS